MTAQTIAMSRTLGLADAIDGICTYENRNVTPGDVFELMLGAIAAKPERTALMNIREVYEGAPLKALFDRDIAPENLNASALARGLDAIGAAKGKTRLQWNLAQKAKKRFGFDSKVDHGDGTVAKFTGDEKDRGPNEEVAVAKFGHPKISDYKKYRQYNGYGIVDGDRILNSFRPYDGNYSDVTMNKDALDFLSELDDVKERIYVADCKLATAGILDKMDGMNIGYVTKIPDNSIDNARDEALKAAIPELDMGSKDGHIKRFADVTVPIHGADRRFVVMVNTVKFGEAKARIRTKVRSDLDALNARIAKKTFKTQDAAVEELKSKLTPAKIAGHKVGWEFSEEKRRVKPHQGKDAKDEEYETVYRMSLRIEYDEDLTVFEAVKSSGTVLITNLSDEPSEDGDIRKGADAMTILDLYNGQFACEHAFRLMKSGIGLDAIYLQTPQRVDAMLFIVSLAAMMFTLMDAILRRQDVRVGHTFLRLRIVLQNSRLLFEEGEWVFEGPPDKEELFAERLAMFSVDPDTFLAARDRRIVLRGRAAPGRSVGYRQKIRLLLKNRLC